MAAVFLGLALRGSGPLIIAAGSKLSGGPWKIIRRDTVPVFLNPGVASHQLISAQNSASTRLSVTRVVLGPGARNPRHRHVAAEQVWVALSGSGLLLLADAATLPFAAGDVARFADGDVHGFENAGADDFVYLAVTSPPQDFRAAYAGEAKR